MRTPMTEATATPPLLELSGVGVTYGTPSWLTRLGLRPAPKPAVCGIDLALHRGDAVGIVGESGSGKSTLARSIAGLIAPTTGEIRLAGEQLAARRTRSSQRSIQMVFQDPSSSLNPRRTVRQVLAELLIFHSLVPRSALEGRCAELLALVELPVTMLDSYPRALSGGQRQRIGIARALALEPQLLIADEAVAALDVSVQASVLNLLADLRSELHLTLIFISHDLGVVRHVSDRILVMKDGRVVEDNATERVFANPQHPYTQELLAAGPTWTAG